MTKKPPLPTPERPSPQRPQQGQSPIDSPAAADGAAIGERRTRLARLVGKLLATEWLREKREAPDN